MRLKRLGEDAFIKEIEKIFRCPSNKKQPRVVKGIGDDTAVTESKKNKLLSTTDTLVEGVHFKTSYAEPHLIGKALAVSSPTSPEWEERLFLL